MDGTVEAASMADDLSVLLSPLTSEGVMKSCACMAEDRRIDLPGAGVLALSASAEAGASISFVRLETPSGVAATPWPLGLAPLMPYFLLIYVTQSVPPTDISLGGGGERSTHKFQFLLF